MPHNGSRVQIGLGFIYSGHPFINLVKQAQGWFNHNDGSPHANPNILDANGWPTTDNPGHGGSKFNFLLYQPQENLVARWDGGQNGVTAIQFSISGSGFVFGSGATGRVVIPVTTSTPSIEVSITTTGSPRVTNLRICFASNEAAMEAGVEIFDPTFKSRMGEAGIIRFLDWQNSNGTNITKWAHRNPVAWWSWFGPYYPSGFFQGTTTSGTPGPNDYAITVSGFSLVDKATLTLVFDHQSTAGSAATLNVSGTGAIPLAEHYGNKLSVSGAINQTPPNTSNSTVVYDQSLNIWIINEWSPYSLGGVVSWVPPEICFRLCNEVGAHPWFCMPYLTADCGTGQLPTVGDYAALLATYCRDNQPSWMKPKFETPNETWNFTFFSSRYGDNKQATRMGTALQSLSNQNEWIGTVGYTLGKAISDVYSADHSKYDWIIGYAAFSSATNPPNDITSKQGGTRVTSNWYVAHGGTAASTVATAICYADYFNSWYTQTPMMFRLGSQFMAEPNSTNRDSILATYIAACNTWDSVPSSGGFSIPQLAATIMVDIRNWATSKGLSVYNYEGGYSPDFKERSQTFIRYFTAVSVGATTTITCAIGGNEYQLVSSITAADVGMWFRCAGFTGVTGLTGTFQVLAATGTTITLNVATSGTWNGVSPGPTMECVAVYTVTGIAKGNPTTVTVSETVSVPTTAMALGNYQSTNHADVQGVGGTTGLNGNNYSIGTIGTHTFDLSVDSSAMGNYTSGGQLIIPGSFLVNAFHYLSKSYSTVKDMSLLMYQTVTTGGVLMPSEFELDGQWSPYTIWDPNPEVTTPPRWLAIQEWNDAVPTGGGVTTVPLMLALRLRLHA